MEPSNPIVLLITFATVFPPSFIPTLSAFILTGERRTRLYLYVLLMQMHSTHFFLLYNRSQPVVNGGEIVKYTGATTLDSSYVRVRRYW